MLNAVLLLEEQLLGLRGTGGGLGVGVMGGACMNLGKL